MHRNFHFTALATAIAFSIMSPVHADDAKTLDTITVTAHRIAISIDEALASVTVLTREDIEASQAPDLVDLLGRQAGIDISRNGGPGQASTVFLRGSNSNHTLVLIDGLRVNSAGQGLFDFAHLPLARIERIEIVRGPRAALWGSDAIGGVIHIFTRETQQMVGELRAGSYGRVGADAVFGHGNAEQGLSIGIGNERLRGFSATNAAAWEFSPDDYDPDADGYRNHSLNLSARTPLGNQHLHFTGIATDADVEFDNGESDARSKSLGMNLTGALTAGWEHALLLGHAREDLDNRASWGANAVQSRRHSLDWMLSRPVDGAGTMNLGINIQNERTHSLGDSDLLVYSRSRNNRAGFVSWHGDREAFDYELALRHDDNSQYGGGATGQAALGWQLGDHFRIRASWGEGFRAPNFNELYHPGFFGWFAGNPNLEPERSRSSEIGLQWAPGNGHRVDLSLYRSDIQDLISFSNLEHNYEAENIARAELEGAELGYAWSRDGFSLNAQASWQDARNVDTGDDLLRRAKRKLSVSTDYRFGNGWTLGLDGLGVAARPDFGVDLPGFARFDLRLSAPLAAGWALEARIENLGDRFYQWANGYNTPDRSALLRLRYTAD
ncbi:MAG TPA: TonB-dependent receptor [Arenimonas sp.]|nr:TonB-dependent receptor [Arenimonas sp.]